MTEWRKYKVGTPSSRYNWTEPSCQPFGVVGHASHIDSALSIVRDNQLRQSLVFDKSKLNTSRILVVWLSPNHWSPGYRYGGIKFDFEFRRLAQGKKYFWVEAITDYSPPACRILITDQDRSSILPPYDPTSGDGPWWFDSASNTDYFNGTYCLEFMIESPIPLIEARHISFVDHHAKYCAAHRTSPTHCNELGMRAGRCGALFLLKACASNMSLVDISRLMTEIDGSPSSDVVNAFQYMLEAVRREVIYLGPVTETDTLSIPLTRAVVNATVVRRNDEAKELASIFLSEDALLKALANMIGKIINVNDVSGIYSRMIW